MADRETGATLQELVGDALRDGADLARKEFGLFRAEMASNASGFAKAAVLFLVAAVFAVASLIWLTQAIVYGLDVLLHRPWLSALIVGGALALIAGILAFVGKGMISATSLAPTRTVASLKRDGDVLTERTIG